MDRPRRLTELTGQILGVARFRSGPLVIALSGGADSATLAALAPHPVRAVHVHHGQPHSDRMESAARAIARRLDLPIEVQRVEVERSGFEEAARRARYEVFERVLGPGEWMATAHTLDDVAETVLMRMARGAGLDGLVAIPHLRPPFVRPFLRVGRSQTREYATLAGLEWVEDPTNLELVGVRNRVRHILIPALCETFGHDPTEALARSALNLAEEQAVLDELVSGVEIVSGEGWVGVGLPQLTGLSPPLRSRLIRAMWGRLGFVYPPDREPIERVLEVVAGRVRSTQVGQGVIAVVAEGLLQLRRSVASPRENGD